MSSTRVRHGGALIGAVLTCLLAAGPAAAAPATVEITNDAFGPTAVTVSPGDSVTWHWAGSGHNVKLSGAEAFATAFNDAGATFAHVFTTPGTYLYVCQAHGGMKGQVVVAAAAPAADAPAAATAAAPGSAAPAADAPAPGAGASPTVPRIAALRTSPSGALLRVQLPAPARLRATVARMTRAGWRTLRRVDAPAGAGRTDLRWTRAAIQRGRYRVTVVASSEAGSSAPVLRRFVVRRRIGALGPAAPAMIAPAVSPAVPQSSVVAEPPPAPPVAPAVAPAPAPPAPRSGGDGDHHGDHGDHGHD